MADTPVIVSDGTRHRATAAADTATVAGGLTATADLTGDRVIASNPNTTYAFTDFMQITDGAKTGTWGLSDANGQIASRSGGLGQGFRWYDSNSTLLGLLDGGGDFVATGGFRHSVGPYTQDNVAASQTTVALTGDRWIATRAGSVVGVVVKATEARTAGTLTIEVYKNTGLSGATGSGIGLTAVLDGTNTSKKATTQAKDTDAFAAGDEIYAVITTDGSWAPTTSDIRVWLEVEQ